MFCKLKRRVLSMVILAMAALLYCPAIAQEGQGDDLGAPKTQYFNTKPGGQPQSGAPAAGMANSPAVEKIKSVEQARRAYAYMNIDNRDPFESLILEKVETKEGVEPKDPREMFDIEVIKVVAIIHDEKQGYASVRLPDGKFYTLVKGTKVGIHGGVVREILKDRVVVRQEIMNFKRELVEQIRELKLREEEEQ